MEREQVPGNVFSSLAKGRGTWKGELELDLLVDFDKDGTPILPSLTREPSGFASSSNLGSMHRSKSATTLSTSSYKTEKSDGEINIPKTFITRSGALLLFTAPNNVELSAFQKQQLQKGLLKARRADVRSKFGTLTRFAKSVLTFGDENYPKDSASISDTDNPVFLRFLHDLDNSDMVDLRAKPGADPAFYLRDLKARAHSARSSKSGRVSSAHWQRAHTFSYGFGPEYHEEPEVSIVSPSPPLPQFPVDESDKLPSDSPRTGDNLQNYPYAVPPVREDSPQLSDEGQYVTAEELPRKMDELLIFNEGDSPKFSGFRGRAKSICFSEDTKGNQETHKNTIKKTPSFAFQKSSHMIPNNINHYKHNNTFPIQSKSRYKNQPNTFILTNSLERNISPKILEGKKDQEKSRNVLPIVIRLPRVTTEHEEPLHTNGSDTGVMQSPVYQRSRTDTDLISMRRRYSLNKRNNTKQKLDVKVSVIQGPSSSPYSWSPVNSRNTAKLKRTTSHIKNGVRKSANRISRSQTSLYDERSVDYKDSVFGKVQAVDENKKSISTASKDGYTFGDVLAEIEKTKRFKETDYDISKQDLEKALEKVIEVNVVKIDKDLTKTHNSTLGVTPVSCCQPEEDVGSTNDSKNITMEMPDGVFQESKTFCFDDEGRHFNDNHDNSRKGNKAATGLIDVSYSYCQEKKRKSAKSEKKHFLPSVKMEMYNFSLRQSRVKTDEKLNTKRLGNEINGEVIKIENKTENDMHDTDWKEPMNSSCSKYQEKLKSLGLTKKSRVAWQQDSDNVPGSNLHKTFSEPPKVSISDMRNTTKVTQLDSNSGEFDKENKKGNINIKDENNAHCSGKILKAEESLKLSKEANQFMTIDKDTLKGAAKTENGPNEYIVADIEKTINVLNLDSKSLNENSNKEINRGNKEIDRGNDEGCFNDYRETDFEVRNKLHAFNSSQKSVHSHNPIIKKKKDDCQVSKVDTEKNMKVIFGGKDRSLQIPQPDNIAKVYDKIKPKENRNHGKGKDNQEQILKTDPQLDDNGRAGGSARLSPRYSSRSSIPERPLTTGSVLRASGDLLSADTGSLVAQYLDKSSSQHRSPNSAYARKYSASYHGSVPEMQQSNSSGDIARPNTPSSRASSTMSFHTQPLSGEGSRSSLKSRPGSVYDSGGISSAGSCVHSNIPTAITSVNISHKGAQHAAPPHPDSILAHPAEVRLDEEELPPHRKAWEKEDGCEDSIASYDMPDHDLMFDSAGGDMLHSVSMDDLDQINTHRRDSGRGDGLGAAHPLQAPYQGVGLMTVKAGSTFSISSSVPSEDREHMLAELENLPDSRQGERDVPSIAIISPEDRMYHYEHAEFESDKDGIQSVISVEISRRGSSASVESLDPLDVVPSSESKIPSEDALPSHDSMHKKEPERVSTDEVLKEEVEMTISSKNGAPQYKSSTSLLDSHSDIHLNEENGDLKEKFSPPPSSFLHSETDIATKTPSEPLSKPGPPLPKSPSVTSSTKRTHTPPIRTDKLPVDITEGVSEISAQTGTRSSSSKGLDRRGSQPQYVQAFDITSVQSDKHAESPTSRQEIRAESVVNDTQAELTRLFGSVTPVKKPGKHGKSKGKKSVSIRQSPLPKKTKEEEDIDRLEEEVGTLLAATTENNENTEVGLSQEELELATEMLKEKVAIAEDRIQSAGKKDKKEKNKKNKKVGERKDLTEQKEKLRLQREEEKQRRLQEAQQLQQKIKEQAEEKQKHEEETDKRKTELADELSMIARAAEEARQMEEEARAALSAARKSTREEREAKRKADLERKKAEAAQKREEEKRLKEEGRRREREMLEKISTSEQRRKMAEEDRLRREEEEWEEEQARMEEEERLAKLALDEEARIAAHEKEAEEEAMEKLVAERLEMEKKRKLLEAESKRIQEEEELERRKLEEEQKKLEEEKRQQEEYLLKKQEEEQTRLNELRVMESEARKKMKDEMEKRRQAALARREVNLDRHNHLNGLKKEQGITKPWTFSYYVLWPRDNYEKLMGDDTTKKKRRSVKPKASSAPKS